MSDLEPDIDLREGLRWIADDVIETLHELVNATDVDKHEQACLPRVTENICAAACI